MACPGQPHVRNMRVIATGCGHTSQARAYSRLSKTQYIMVPCSSTFAYHCPMTFWVCQWKPFWIPVDDSFEKTCGGMVLLVNANSERSLSESQGDVARCLIVTMDHRKTRTQLVLGNVLRHHCLHCSHDLHVNVWNYPSLVMLFRPATRILSHKG